MFTRTRMLVAAVLLAIGVGGVAIQAHAYNCTTTCYNIGNQRICNTNCW